MTLRRIERAYGPIYRSLDPSPRFAIAPNHYEQPHAATRLFGPKPPLPPEVLRAKRWLASA